MDELKLQILWLTYCEKPLSELTLRGFSNERIVLDLSLLQSDGSTYYSDKKVRLTSKGINSLRQALDSKRLIRSKKDDWIRPLMENRNEQRRDIADIYLPDESFDI